MKKWKVLAASLLVFGLFGGCTKATQKDVEKTEEKAAESVSESINEAGQEAVDSVQQDTEMQTKAITGSDSKEKHKSLEQQTLDTVE